MSRTEQPNRTWSRHHVESPSHHVMCVEGRSSVHSPDNQGHQYLKYSMTNIAGACKTWSNAASGQIRKKKRARLCLRSGWISTRRRSEKKMVREPFDSEVSGKAVVKLGYVGSHPVPRSLIPYDLPLLSFANVQLSGQPQLLPLLLLPISFSYSCPRSQ